LSSATRTWIVVHIETWTAGGDIGTIVLTGLTRDEATARATSSHRFYNSGQGASMREPWWRGPDDPVVGRVVRCTAKMAWPRDERGEQETLAVAIRGFDAVFGTEEAG
jgi:hypothetical protein